LKREEGKIKRAKKEMGLIAKNREAIEARGDEERIFVKI